MVDSTHIAVMVGPIAIMFFISWVGFRLTEGNNRTHEAIGLFLLLMGFVHTIIVTNISRSIAKANTLSPSVITSLTQNYFAAVIIFIVVMIYFVLRIMIIPMLQANKRKKLGMSEE